MSGIAWLQKTDPPTALPPTSRALAEPNGLLAVGGALTPEWLIHAYRRGVFPWYSAEQPILWWAPDPRAVLLPSEFRTSRSLARSIAKRGYETRINTAFQEVIEACAGPRRGLPGTWITREMHEAYVLLHRRGLAHSFETWHEGRLVATHDRVWARGMTITDPAHVAAAKVLREQYQQPRPTPDPHEGLVRDLTDYDRAFGLVDGLTDTITDGEVA